MTLCLICPDLVAGKSGLKLLLPKSLFFNPFVYPKHRMNRDKSIYGLRKTKKLPKNQNRSKLKNKLELIYVFSWTLKVKKHLLWIFLIKWNHLT